MNSAPVLTPELGATAAAPAAPDAAARPADPPASAWLAPLQALGDAAAWVDVAGAQVLAQTPALAALLGLPAPAPLRHWGQALPELLPLLQAAAGQPATGQAQRASAQHVGLQASAVAPGRVLLRVVDQRAQQRELQRQLDDRERLLFTSRAVSVGEMGSTLAHELNQPIGAAANLLRGLRLRLARRAGSTPEPAAQEELQAMERALEQVMFAGRVISRIREFTHSRAPRREPLDLAALLQSSASLLDWDLQRVGVALRLELPGQPVWVLGDEVMLQQVLVNLLRNAIDALREPCTEPAAAAGTEPAPPPGAADKRIQLQLLLPGAQQAEVRVTDNGCGLAPEAQARMFVPFSSTKPTGMGIGLAICRSFVELHQGRLWFSHPPQRGCTFHLGLPLHAAGPSEGEPA
jgi:signal transduction histidine kinase